MMTLDEYDDPPFEQQTDDGTPVCSDEGDIMDSDDSDDEYGYTDYWPIRHAELSGMEPSSSSDVDVNDLPVVQDYVCPERWRRNDVSAYVDTQLLVKNIRRKITICCFSLCGLTDRFNGPELRWCWDCVDRLVWGYRVSCFYFYLLLFYYLFEQMYRSHIMITCLYHNMQQTYTQLNDIYIHDDKYNDN